MRQCEAPPLDKAQSVFWAKTHSNKNRRHRKITQQLRLYGLFLWNGPLFLWDCWFFFPPLIATSKPEKISVLQQRHLPILEEQLQRNYWGSEHHKQIIFDHVGRNTSLVWALFHVLIREGALWKPSYSYGWIGNLPLELSWQTEQVFLLVWGSCKSKAAYTHITSEICVIVWPKRTHTSHTL